jgi:NAD-dependent SIR2 family protein deacetylase
MAMLNSGLSAAVGFPVARAVTHGDKAKILMSLENDVRWAAEAIKAADALLICAGAGMGVDSGLPDFRGTQGFWRAYPVLAKLGISFEEMANPAWFEKDPALAWAFYGHRLSLYRNTIPHAGFSRLLAISASKPRGYYVFTSNVDGQFHKAGFSRERIVECHGSIHHLQCVSPCTDEIWEAGERTVAIDEGRFRALDPLPRCKNCPALARPNIHMFGDGSWLSHRTGAQQERFYRWLNGLHRASAKLVLVEIGAGSTIPTVRRTSERVIEQLGGKLIRINPREQEVPMGHMGLPFGAAEGIARTCPGAG